MMDADVVGSVGWLAAGSVWRIVFVILAADLSVVAFFARAVENSAAGCIVNSMRRKLSEP